ncbi:hypothetical protein Esti_005508 [Eimeria stiedai]
MKSCASPREKFCCGTRRRLWFSLEPQSAFNLNAVNASKGSSSISIRYLDDKGITRDVAEEETQSTTPEEERPLSTLFLWFGWRANHQQASDLKLGVLPASAALCADNICVNGTCYETAGLRTCVCDLPFTGPLCDSTVSLCSGDCGIPASTGIACSSALCSLGTCIDTNTAPYFKCECGDFFMGANCETHNNPCTNPAANPCGEGTCTFVPGKGSGTVTCTCHADYEAATGAGMTTVKWGNSEVIQGPPCTVRKSRGMAKLNFNLTSGQLIVWWAVFATAILLLAWCCYAVCSENCSHWVMAWKAARVVKG